MITYWLLAFTASAAISAGFANRDFCEAARHALPADMQARAVCVSTGAAETMGERR